MMETVNTNNPPDFEILDDSSGGLGGGFDLQAFADEVADIVEPEEAPGQSQEIKALKAKIKELELSRQDEDNKHKRLLADFQNLRNRSSREIQSGIELAERQMLLEILQVLDSFNRCLGSSYQTIEDFRTGVGLIEKQFHATLRRLKVNEIEINIGDIFDAHTAEALTAVDAKDFPPGSVVEVCEKGFRISDQLLRPARVIVARSEQAN
jgi:molecular chaperone GrpE